MPTFHTSPLCSHFAQILTAQFRQMEQELSEAMKLREEERQQWAEQASKADVELAALRTSLEAREQSEEEHISQEALQKEKMEVARLEGELALIKEAEVTANQASLDASERDRVKIAQLENDLASMREAAAHASEDASQRMSQVSRLERQLASLQEEQAGAEKKNEIVAQIWRRLQSLALEDVQAAEDIPAPADLSLLLDTVQSFETKLMRLKESEERCAELIHSMKILQGEHLWGCLRIILQAFVLSTRLSF